MTTYHDAIAALPSTGSADKQLLRNLLIARDAYVLNDADNITGIVLVDPVSGASPIDILYLGRIFHFDALDTTTAHDGTSCLVSSDGLRYKLASGTDVFAYSVLNNTTSTPPASPTVGDAYLVAAGATGAWSGKSNYIATFTRRGWEFVNFSVGRFIYVQAIDTYYHQNTGGAWVTGLGNQIFSANSVPMSAAINFGRRVIVENQTTTSPPASPSVGTAYIIGPSATGAWAGNDTRLAVCEVAGTFTIYNPAPGWLAYDKAQGVEFVYSASASAWTTTAFAVKRIFSGTGTYNVTAADNNRTLSCYGGTFQAIIFPSDSSLPPGFSCKIFNEETTPVGKGIGGTNLGSFTLYPTQGYSIGVVNGIVTVLDGGLKRYKISSIQLYAHSSNGSDDPLVVDGLSDSTRAFKTGAAMKAALYGNFDHNGSQPVCWSTGVFPAIVFAGQPVGTGVFFWNGTAPGAYIQNATGGGGAWIIGDGCVMECTNVTWANGGASAIAIQLHQTAILDILSGCTFDNFGSGTHIGSDGAGWTLNINASYTIANGGNASAGHIALNGSGVHTLTGGITITINGGPAPVINTWLATNGPILVNTGGGITLINQPATGCRRWAIGPAGWLSTAGFAYPGSVAGIPAGNLAPTANNGWVN